MKLRSSNDDDASNKDNERMEPILQRIEELKQQIADKQAQERQRKHAKDSHGKRFLERQRLTRLEHKARQEDNHQEAETTKEALLRRIALDQVYVAHYPLERKYMALFHSQQRRVDDLKTLKLRASIRQQILKQVATDKDLERVSWIANDQYQRLPKEWTVELEQDVFGCLPYDKSKRGGDKEQMEDDRFALQPRHEALLQAAQQLEKQIEEDGDGSVSSSSDPQGGTDDEEDVDDADPLTKLSDVQGSTKTDDDGSTSSSSSSDEANSSSDDSSSKAEKIRNKRSQNKRTTDDSNNDSDSDSTSSDSDSSSSSDEDSDSDDKLKAKPSNNATTDQHTKLPTNVKDDDDFDDFLVPASDEADSSKAFDKPREYVPGLDQSRGDKSKGWDTQRQRPGQFKKKRVRR